jgi:hypothetical protein
MEPGRCLSAPVKNAKEVRSSFCGRRRSTSSAELFRLFALFSVPLKVLLLDLTSSWLQLSARLSLSPTLSKPKHFSVPAPTQRFGFVGFVRPDLFSAISILLPRRPICFAACDFSVVTDSRQESSRSRSEFCLGGRFHASWAPLICFPARSAFRSRVSRLFRSCSRPMRGPACTCDFRSHIKIFSLRRTSVE